MLRNKHKILLAVIIFIASILRLWKLNSLPVSLFGDEMDVGYQAYSILKTGKDYYGNFLPFHFHSLAEWRTPLYLYSAVPTVFLFGITPLGVRLPAAIFGIINVLAFYYLVRLIRQKYFENTDDRFEIIAAFVLAISPWHIQYSRAAFEVTELLLFFTLGLYFFLKSLNNHWSLHLSALFFALMPWIYSSAKLFIPILIPILVLLFRNDLFKSKKKNLLGSGILFVIVSLPIIFSILFGSGSQRFGYISVFSTSEVEQQIGEARDLDSSAGTAHGRIFHNKFASWGESITNNFLQTYSTDFLFINGDINPRHSIENMGMFYKVEIIALFVGLVALFSGKKNKTLLILIAVLLIAGAIPSSITKDGGNHATRLILILLPLVFVISYGIYSFLYINNRLMKTSALVLYFSTLAILFVHYQHQYWVHNPFNSEKWWHYGWEQAVTAIKEEENKYDKVVISTADEPPWVFFAASYQYSPESWQSKFPTENKLHLEGFGEISYIDKFYFGSPEMKSVYDFGKVMDTSTLYLASAKEVGVDLIKEPERTPNDLNLVRAISFPSGAPAFYLFSKK